MSELATLDTTSDIANLDLTERDPHLDTLLTEMTNAALPFVPETERTSFMHAATGMLRELQYEESQHGGRLPLDRLGAVAEHYSNGARFGRAGVRVMPFTTQEGGFVLATTVGPEKQQALVHVAVGTSWQNVFANLSTAGQGQGVDRFDRPRDDEDSFRFQRRALATIEHVAYDNTDVFQPVVDTLVEAHKALPGQTAVTFGMPNIGTNATIDIAYARIDGSDIMGEPYERLARKYGGIDYGSARAIVAYQTGFQISNVLRNMIPVVGMDK